MEGGEGGREGGKEEIYYITNRKRGDNLRLEEEATEALVDDGEDGLARGGRDGHERNEAEHGNAACGWGEE